MNVYRILASTTLALQSLTLSTIAMAAPWEGCSMGSACTGASPKTNPDAYIVTGYAELKAVAAATANATSPLRSQISLPQNNLNCGRALVGGALDNLKKYNGGSLYVCKQQIVSDYKLVLSTENAPQALKASLEKLMGPDLVKETNVQIANDLENKEIKELISGCNDLIVKSNTTIIWTGSAYTSVNRPSVPPSYDSDKKTFKGDLASQKNYLECALNQCTKELGAENQHCQAIQSAIRGIGPQGTSILAKAKTGGKNAK